MIDDALLDLYSARMKELGASIKEDRPLDSADVSVKRRSPLCGSQVTFDITVDGDERLAAVGYKVRACALSEAATGIVVAAAPGSTLSELRQVRAAVRTMLKQDDAPLPDGKWKDLEVLRPAAFVKSRHGSAMLPFDTVVEAMEKALGMEAAPEKSPT